MSVSYLCSSEIRLEAESFDGASKLVKNEEYYSGGAARGKWYGLSRQVKIEEPGLYYLWVRFSGQWRSYKASMGEAAARRLRHFSVEIAGQRLIYDDEVDGGECWSVRRVVLPAGDLRIALRRIGVDPYVDVVILTKDYNYLPEPRHHIQSGKRVPDILAGRAQYPPAAVTTTVPRGQQGDSIALTPIAAAAESDANTTLSVSHDGTNLRVVFNCVQPRADLQCDDHNIREGDCVELILDANNSMNTLRCITVNPEGRCCFTKISGVYQDQEWHPQWDIHSAIKENAWSVELNMPMAELFDTMPGKVGEIRANFQRKTKGRTLARWSKLDECFESPEGFGVLQIAEMPENEWYALWRRHLNTRAAYTVVDRVESVFARDIPWEFHRLYGSGLFNKPVRGKIDLAELWEFEQRVRSVEEAHYNPPGDDAMGFEGVNLFPNPGFEYGRVMDGYVLPLGWRGDDGGTAAIVKDAQSGHKSMLVKVLHDKCVVVPGTRPYLDSTLKYEWRGWFKGSLPQDGKAVLRVKWFVLDVDKQGGWGEVKPGGESRIEFVPGSEWQEVVLNAEPVAGAVQCEFEIELEGKGSELFCDHFTFDGMGVHDVDFLVPQPGFDSSASKRAVIWSRQELDPEYKLLCNNKVVHSGKLVKYGTSRWKGSAYFAEFSDVKAQDKYTLLVNVDDIKHLSPEFVIEDDLYLKHAKLASQFYYIQRQGVDVPGWHKANFLDDALLVDVSTGKIVGHKDFSGGWQDAGDPSKQACSDISIYGLAEFFENTGVVEYELKEKYPDILSLAWAEVDRQINKCYAGNGLFYDPAVRNVSYTSWSGKAKEVGYHTRSVHMVDPSKWTDNTPNTWDDRYVPSKPILQQMTSGLSKFAIAIKKYDESVSAQIAKIMEEDFAARLKNQDALPAQPLVRLAKGGGELCRTATHLWVLTGDERYRQAAERYVREIIRSFDLKLYINEPYHELTSGNLRWSYYNLAVALFDYARYLPETPHLGDIKRVIGEYIEEGFIRRSADNEFGIVTHYTPGPGLRVGHPKLYTPYYPQPASGYNQQLASMGYLAARAAVLCDKPEYLDFADRAAQWITGRNPKGTSMLIGNGWKFAATSTELSYCKGHEDGVLPGTVIRGMIHRPNTPPEFPALNVSSNPGGRAACQMHEVYQRDTIAFITLCQQLHTARKRMK